MPYKDRKKQVAFQSAWMVERRRAWLQENGPCRHCGTWDNLEVDHINPADKVTHRVWSWSEERRNAELAKCQPLCGPCHKRKDHPRTHGKSYKAGCRCNLCKEGHREEIAAWRARVRSRAVLTSPPGV